MDLGGRMIRVKCPKCRHDHPFASLNAVRDLIGVFKCARCNNNFITYKYYQHLSSRFTFMELYMEWERTTIVNDLIIKIKQFSKDE